MALDPKADQTAPIVINGAMPSTEVRTQLAREGRPVRLAFSPGKDSLAAWLALRDAGVEVAPFHLYLVPDLEFVDESLAAYERFFDTRIPRLPHPSLYRWLNVLMSQPPGRRATRNKPATWPGSTSRPPRCDFGRLNIMLNRYMLADQIAVASLDELAPVFRRVPGRGFLSPSPWPRPARATGSRSTARAACVMATNAPTARSPDSPPQPPDRRQLS